MGTVRNRSSEEKKKTWMMMWSLVGDVQENVRLFSVCVCEKEKNKRQFTMKNLKPASVTFLFFFFFFSFVLFGAQNIITP